MNRAPSPNAMSPWLYPVVLAQPQRAPWDWLTLSLGGILVQLLPNPASFFCSRVDTKSTPNTHLACPASQCLLSATQPATVVRSFLISTPTNKTTIENLQAVIIPDICDALYFTQHSYVCLIFSTIWKGWQVLGEQRPCLCYELTNMRCPA